MAAERIGREREATEESARPASCSRNLARWRKDRSSGNGVV